MKKYCLTLVILMIYSLSYGQSFEGVLKVEYKDEAGKTNSAQVFIKGDKYYIKRITGGCEKYSAYLLDLKTHSLSCLSDHTPKTAVVFNTDKVLDIYEKNNLKPGYKVHESQNYQLVSSTKQIGGLTASEKRQYLDTVAYSIWVADIKIDYHTMIPVLRIAGFWNQLEDGNNAILEGKVINKKTTNKTTTISVTPAITTINSSLFDIPKDFQTVDLNKFITEQTKSPKLSALVKAFAGF